jgi:hypothetical protein
MLAAPQNARDGIVANIPFQQRLGKLLEFNQLVAHIVKTAI